MLKAVRVQDESTKFCWRWEVKNKTLTLQLSFCQFIVALTSLAQHVYSYYFYKNIFFCRFVNDDNTSLTTGGFLAYDIIIFDFGLFREILGVKECVANHLDGGYLRCMWCGGQTLSILLALCVIICGRKLKRKSWFLWPMLTTQNIYCIGVIILTIATLGKLVLAVINDLTGRLVWLALIYLSGAVVCNCFLNYILWHYYWHLESIEKSNNNDRRRTDNGRPQQMTLSVAKRMTDNDLVEALNG